MVKLLEAKLIEFKFLFVYPAIKILPMDVTITQKTNRIL